MMLGYQASSCETSCDFFFSIRPTDPVRNAFDVKRKKKGGGGGGNGLIPNHRLGDQNFPGKKEGQGLAVPTTHVR